MNSETNFDELIDSALSEAIDEANESLAADEAVALTDEAALFGGGGPLDSIGLVNFVVAVEQAVEDRAGRSIVLASEKAMSRRSSPFRSVGALRAFLRELLAEGES